MERDFWSAEALAARLGAAKALISDFVGYPGVQSLELGEEIKSSAQATVYRAILNGTQVIIKRFHDQDAAHTVVCAKAELDHLERVFGDSDCQANRCVMALPEKGILVLSLVPGRRLGEEIDRLSGKAREKVLEQSGRWILRYAEGRTKRSRFWPGRWIRRLEKKSIDHVSNPDDLALLSQLLRTLRRMVPLIRGTTALKAAVHGDFVGLNAHYHEGVLYGVDIQGQSSMIVAREVSRFLVWQQIHDDARGGQRKFGINQSDWLSILSSDVLSEHEQATTLPFFVGEQLYLRFVSNYHRSQIRTNSQYVIEAFLAENW